MKRILLLTAIGLLCFVAGTAGIYLAMPSIAPDTVEHARVRLDSLGLIRNTAVDAVADASSSPEVPVTPEVDPDTEGVSDSTRIGEILPSPQEIIQTLKDSINTSNNIIHSLQADTSSMSRQLESLLAQVDVLSEKDFEATELSQSLARLDAKQLGSILANVDMDIITMLYEKASARERTRMLEAMSPEQAARFVQTLVKGPQPLPEPDDRGDATNSADDSPPNP